MALMTILLREPIVAALGLAAACALMCGLEEPPSGSVPAAEADAAAAIDAEYRAASALMLYRGEQRTLIAEELDRRPSALPRSRGSLPGLGRELSAGAAALRVGRLFNDPNGYPL
jgi:hypothetical protein